MLPSLLHSQVLALLVCSALAFPPKLHYQTQESGKEPSEGGFRATHAAYVALVAKEQPPTYFIAPKDDAGYGSFVEAAKNNKDPVSAVQQQQKSEGDDEKSQHDHKASYKFEYTVHDPHTGDLKRQWEHSEGGVVNGQYSLVEPDGSLRTVIYTAHPKTGFHATVRKAGVNKHPITAKAYEARKYS